MLLIVVTLARAIADAHSTGSFRNAKCPRRVNLALPFFNKLKLVFCSLYVVSKNTFLPFF